MVIIPNHTANVDVAVGARTVDTPARHRNIADGAVILSRHAADETFSFGTAADHTIVHSGATDCAVVIAHHATDANSFAADAAASNRQTAHSDTANFAVVLSRHAADINAVVSA